MDKKDWFWTVVTFAGLIGLIVITKSVSTERHVVVYDCRISEISPDYPVEVKEQCRKLRSQQ